MPLPVLPGVLRITAAGTMSGGGRWTNTWHAENDSGIDFDEAGIAAFHAIFSQFYVGPALGTGLGQTLFWHSNTTIDSISYTPLNGTSGAFQISTAATGGAVSATLPPEVAEVITIRTAARGRANRGRIFLPAWTAVNANVLGHILPASLQATLDQLQAVHTSLITGGAHLGVGSYGPYKNPSTGLLEPGTPHFTPANNFTMDDLFDVQRSRKV